MPDQPPGNRAILLACSVRTLRRARLEVHCCRTALLPLRLMAATPGMADRTLANVLVQLRCRECHRRPSNVALMEDPVGGAHGRVGASGWRVVLVEDEVT